MQRTKTPVRRAARRPALGVRFDRKGRIYITDPVLRERIERRLKTQGTVEVYTPAGYTPGGINELCPTPGGTPKVNPINAMCACGFTLKDRTIRPSTERTRRPR
jgi:hypothetical protein